MINIKIHLFLPVTLMKKIIPPILTALLGAISLSLMLVSMPPRLQILPTFSAWSLALLFFVTGSIIAIAGKRQFQSNDSEIHPFRQPRNLVTYGLFRYSRNPMYLGFCLMLLGLALFVNLWPALLSPAIFFFVADSWYIPHEEQAATTAFGDAYILYRKQVRRWI